MKKLLRNLIAGALAMVLCVSAIPATAEAAVNPPKEITTTMRDSSGSVSFSIGDAAVVKDSVKTDASWLKPNYVNNDSSKWEYFYYNEKGKYDKKRDSKSTSKYAYISLRATKTGTATVTYKIGKKEYKTKVTVKPYVNPVKSIQSSALNSGKNFASKTKKNSSVTVKCKTLKSTNQTISVQAAKGYSVSSISYSDVKSGKEITTRFSTPVKSGKTAKAYVGQLKKGSKKREYWTEYSQVYVSLVSDDGNYTYLYYTLN